MSNRSSSDHGTARRATTAWLLLVGATLLAWTAGEHGAAGPAAVLLLFGLAFAKGTVVILDFMALRRAPLMWPVIALGWLTLVCALIGLAYWKGIAT